MHPRGAQNKKLISNTVFLVCSCHNTNNSISILLNDCSPSGCPVCLPLANMKHSRLQSILTAAIVDYCQTNDLYIAELHIQGTVCISSDGAPTLVTQLSEKVSTNNNRWVVGGGHVRKSPPPQQILDHRPDAEELALLRYLYSEHNLYCLL